MSDPPVQALQRFIAIDLHKRYLMIGGIDAHKNIVLQPRKLDFQHFAHWAHTNLLTSDAVVIEATTNAWHIYDQLVARVVVAHPAKVKLIAAARVKTHKIDVFALINLLRADLLPEVWVPPLHVRDLRALISHRRRLVSLQTTAKNRLQSVLHRLNLPSLPATPLLASSVTGGANWSCQPPNACVWSRICKRSTTSPRRLKHLMENCVA